MSILDEYRAFGITGYFPCLNFSAEVPLNGIAESLQEIDEEISELELEEDAKIAYVFQSAIEMAEAVSKGELDTSVGISEISYYLLYTYLKQDEAKPYSELRGIVGCLGEDGLYFSSSSDDAEYSKAVNSLRSSAGLDEDEQDVDGSERDYFTTFGGDKPTIH